jgi:hypothetical protein
MDIRNQDLFEYKVKYNPVNIPAAEFFVANQNINLKLKIKHIDNDKEFTWEGYGS